MNAALGNPFVIGGHLTSIDMHLDRQEAVFFSAGLGQTVDLVLTTTVPEPSTLLLLIPGLLGLAMMGRGPRGVLVPVGLAVVLGGGAASADSIIVGPVATSSPADSSTSVLPPRFEPSPCRAVASMASPSVPAP